MRRQKAGFRPPSPAPRGNLTWPAADVTIPTIMPDHDSTPASKITLEQVRHVARLARIELDAADEQNLQANMSEILTYIDQLNQLDTAEIPPTAQVGEAGTPMRDDVVTNRPAPDEMLANAPAREGHLFKVPKIIEG
jgi:aspartyl-tRNA(Asn)/glutamyl-tRNA(Gln) amidotransferase subunit C